MKKLNPITSPFAYLFLAATLLSPVAIAATSSCPTTVGTQVSLSTINPETNGMSGGGTISTGGCIATDETFGNFGISGFTGVTTVPTLSGVDLHTNTANPGQEFITNMSAAEADPQGGIPPTATGDFTLFTQFGTSQPVVNPGINNLILELVNVNIPGAVNGFFARIIMTISVCENPTGLNGAGNNGSLATFTACTSLGGTFASTSVAFTNATTNADTGNLFLDLTLPDTIKSIAVDNTISLRTVDQSTTSFGGLDEFFESPEPGSWLLVGSALTGLCLLALRKRRTKLL
jgi:hypothetical protein